MAAGLLLLAAVALAPGLGLDPSADVSAGPLAVSADGTEVAVSADAPVDPVGVPDLGTHVNLPAGLGVGLSVHTGSDSYATAPESSSSGSAGSGPLGAIAQAPPAAVVAGGSLLAGGIGLALWLARPALGLFSRIEDGDLASHPLRRQAIDFISANPGASVKDVQRSLGIAWGTAVYHLGRLERAGLVAVRRAGGRAGHWPLGQAPPRGAPAGTGQALADLVRERPGLSQAELAGLAGIGAPAACKQLRRLESAGLVAATRVGRSRVYHPGVSVSLKAAVRPVAPLADAAEVAQVAEVAVLAPTP